MPDSKRLARLFDSSVLWVLRCIMALGIATAVVILVLLVVRELGQKWGQIDSITELQRAVQSLFAGVLLVVLGLELMDTLRNYFIEHRLRVEFLISVALIAVARHVIQLDYEHTQPWLVASIALLIISLAASYVGVRVLVEGRVPPPGDPP
ncbi:MAG: phosphate-starvation-inducible PsiE family protein [Gammaproteobacteria bacterium]|nr:phosphate-starvation-inducible PsiE family protein [Gammaproteobacteria bacterium]